ncbi:S8 family serine peptidase [Dactylosporangium sp. NPDC005555]|uniref:S8 family peptidase n=1 Tax=Dactylosporangium sp. NPDC005555 TaxID=3154889 RepID=UPI00339EEB7C
MTVQQPITRRTLLTAAAATAVGAFAGAGRAAADPLWYQQAFAALVAADPAIRAASGSVFWYRPRQLLVAPPDLARVEARLIALGHSVAPGAGFGGVSRLWFAADVDIEAIVEDLRDPGNWPAQLPPKVQPHHVAFGYPNVMGNPADAPAAAPAMRPPPAGQAGAGVLVGVCDTGMWALAARTHPGWFGGWQRPSPDCIDPLYTEGRQLALQGGHGTFVTGVLRGIAPSAQFEAAVALSPDGIGDEESVCRALRSLDRSVAFVNLSLGCYTQRDVPSMPLGNAVAALSPDTVVVAAAGNAGSTRPTWPAALGGVTAVAALAPGGRPADYSNRGPWVDVCAPGDATGPFVTGFLRPPEDDAIVFDGFASWQGTSFAVPYVIGRMAGLVSGSGSTPKAADAALRGGEAPFDGYGAVVR